MFGRKKKKDDSYLYETFEGYRFADPDTREIIGDFNPDQKAALKYTLMNGGPTKCIAYKELPACVMLALHYMYCFATMTPNDVWQVAMVMIHDYKDLQYTDLQKDAEKFYKRTMLEDIASFYHLDYQLFNDLKYPSLKALPPKIFYYLEGLVCRTGWDMTDTYRKVIKLVNRSWDGEKYAIEDDKVYKIIRDECVKHGAQIDGDIYVNGAVMAGLTKLPLKRRKEIEFHDPGRADFLNPLK